MPRQKKLASIINAVEVDVIEEKQTEYIAKVEEAVDIVAGTDTFEKLGDNLDNALVHAEAEIARIDERADIAISVVTQSIRTQASVAKGKLLLDIREKYSHVPSFQGSIAAFSDRLGVPASTIRNWMAAASAVQQHENVFGREFLLEQPSSGLQLLNGLPQQVQSAVLEDVKEGESFPSNKELKEIANDTPVKLLSAQEKLEEAFKKKDAATADFELAKADPDCRKGSEEYSHLSSTLHSANRSIETFQKQVDQLKSDLVGEKAKAESAMKAQQKLNEEIESLKFDDTQSREQRIKRISATLTINIPQIISDLMKFVAEESQYQETYRDAIRQQMVQLHTYLGEHV